MRDLILKNLSTAIDASVLEKLLDSYENLVFRAQKGDLDGALGAAGKFVEHTLRAVEFVRTGTAPAEIKFPAQTVKDIEKDARLSEGLRLLVPRIAHSMIYDIRSKRGAVHVKEVDPRGIDAALCVQAASWVMAELLRQYHADEEATVAQALQTLMRPHVPFIEQFGDEFVVTHNVPAEMELLLLLARAAPQGFDRKALGGAAKRSPQTVSTALVRLRGARHVHRTNDGTFHITGPGEQHLQELISTKDGATKGNAKVKTKRRKGKRRG
jgi:hypothetical protein